MQLDISPSAAPGRPSPGGMAEAWQPATRAGLDPSLQAEFAARLAGFRRAYIAQGQPLHSALQLLDIDQIRLRFGRRWPELRRKAIGIVEAVIQRDLGQEEFYLAASDTLFYLFRLGQERRDLERRGRLLAAEITERLCGAIPGGVAVRLTTMPFNHAAALAGVASFAQLRNRVEAHGKALEDAELGLFLNHAGDLQATFRPSLHLRKRLVSAYQLAPVLVREGQTRPLASLCRHSLRGVFDAESDNWSLQQAALALEAPMRSRRPLLIVPVHHETLAAGHLREPFLALCGQLPASAARHLVLEILKLPPSLTQARVRELAAGLAPYCRGVIIRVPEDAVYVEHLGGTGVLGLSLALDALDPEGEAARQTVSMLVEAARSQRLRSLLVEVGSLSLCQHALHAGIDQLNGDALLPAAPQPGRALAMPALGRLRR